MQAPRRSFISRNAWLRRWPAVGVSAPLVLSAAGITFLVGGTTHMILAAGVAALGLALAGCVVWLLPAATRRIDLGADGISIRTRDADDFLPFREVRAIDREELRGFDVVTISMRERDVVLPCRKREVWVEAAIEALASFRAKWTADADTPMVAFLRGKPVTALRELAKENAGAWREASVPLGEIAPLVDDPAMPPDARLAAAIVLRARDALDGERIRAIAGDTAMPGLRRALVRVAEDADEVELEGALDLLRRDERPKAARRT